MNKADLLKEMKDSIGTKSPVEFFNKMVEVFNLLFNRIDDLEKSLTKVNTNTIMLSQWDSRLASSMINDELIFMRKNGKQDDGSNIFQFEMDELQSAYLQGKHVHSYASFVSFWHETLGYHPFLEARKS